MENTQIALDNLLRTEAITQQEYDTLKRSFEYEIYLKEAPKTQPLVQHNTDNNILNENTVQVVSKPIINPPLKTAKGLKIWVGLGVFLLLIIFSVIIFLNKKEASISSEDNTQSLNRGSTQSKEEIIILAKNGVMLRKTPATSGDEIVLMPSGAKVEVIEKTNQQDSFDGNTNYWYRVKYGNIQGYCFGGFTSVGGNTINTQTENKTLNENRIDNFIKYNQYFIKDLNTDFYWYIAPDKDFSFDEASKFSNNTNEGNLKWRIPTFNEIKSLYNPSYRAGDGFLLNNKRYPAKIHNVFNAIGSGSWFWVSDKDNNTEAYNINLHEGIKIAFDSQNSQYPVHLILISDNKQVNTPNKAIYKANGKVYFYNDASYSSKRADYIVEGQKPMSLYKSGDFVYVTFTYNGNTTKGYLPLAELEFIAPVE